MTVRDLIQQLCKYPPEMLVVVNGYEGGETEKFYLKQELLALNANEGLNYYEPHEVESIRDGETVPELIYPECKHCEAVVINRGEQF